MSSVFAILEDGGRQYRVAQGDKVQIDLREGVNAGDALTFDKVLLANGGGDSILGVPAISGATVSAKVVEAIFKGPKLEIQKIRRRHNSRRHTGHRQKHTVVEVTGISVPGLKIVETKEPAAEKAAK
ncbi:50S ribosomal protein L21 [Caulifigura coniformis]|uniref:Large ribosomal subunit protein bL21 n=1 Tax=Caulifigura coniformis TaxID=2527983 RepID=A0A517SK67_9PLAN|nr:50S ribosomal protein L21 [Caulifigura coniformis]QDT56519.1 50S ribosomal protein L21 [Caulifigura coniformis]